MALALNRSINSSDYLITQFKALPGSSHDSLIEDLSLLQYIRTLLGDLELLVTRYGDDILRGNGILGGCLHDYDALLTQLNPATPQQSGSARSRLRERFSRRHEPRNQDRRQRYLEEARPWVLFIFQFALTCHAVEPNTTPTSPLNTTITSLIDIRCSVTRKKSEAGTGSGTGISVNLKEETEGLKEAWHTLCERLGLLLDNNKVVALPVEEILATSLSTHTFLPFARLPEWRWPPRRDPSGNHVATCVIRNREYLLDVWTRSPQKPNTIIWHGERDTMTLEHRLRPETVPNAKHSVYNSDRVVTFPRSHRVVLKRNDIVKYDDDVIMKYTFTTDEYSTIFQQDLRGGKTLVTAADTRHINSMRSSEPEAKLQRIQIWKDNQRADVPLHTISFFANILERKELEFPILLFSNTIANENIGRESRPSLLLKFLIEDETLKVRRERQNSHSSSVHSDQLQSQAGSASISSTSTVWSTTTIVPVQEDQMQLVSRLRCLKVVFDTREGCTHFKDEFEEAYNHDLAAHLAGSLPLRSELRSPIIVATPPISSSLTELPSRETTSTATLPTSESSSIFSSSPMALRPIEEHTVDEHTSEESWARDAAHAGEWYSPGLGLIRRTPPSRPPALNLPPAIQRPDTDDGNPRRMF